MMDLKALERLGITGAEMQVYLALLKLGSSPLSKVVRETGFQKSTVYNSAARLQEKGLVSNVIKDSRKYFEATEPERLMEFIQERKKELDECEEELESTVSKIVKAYGKAKPEAEAHVLAGIEGFKTMRRDVLKNAKGEHLLIGSISREGDVMPKFFKNWNKSRQLKGIRMRVLHKEIARGTKLADKKFMGEYFEGRFLSKEFENPVVINIYGDRVVTVIWEGNYPLCFMLINKGASDAYRKYFNYLWVRATH